MRNKNRIIRIVTKINLFSSNWGKPWAQAQRGQPGGSQRAPRPHPAVEEPGAPRDDLASPEGCLDITLDPARDRSTDTGSFTHRKMGLWVAERGELK